MNDYDVIMEMLRRHNDGKIDLSDEEANRLAMQAKAMGERFSVESKPLSKGVFDFADMATFGLLPDEWRPTSQGQDIIGETGLDKISGTIGSLGGLVTGATAATKGAKMGWNALKKVFAKKKADDIAANIFKGNLLPAGPPVPQLGMGRPLALGQGRPLGLPGPGVGRMGQIGRAGVKDQFLYDRPNQMLPPYYGFQEGGPVKKVTESSYKTSGFDAAKKKFLASSSMTPEEKMAAAKAKRLKAQTVSPPKTAMQRAREAAARHQARLDAGG